MAGALTISGLAAGLASGSKIIGPNTITGGAIVGEILDTALASGDNTFTIPAGAVAWALFIPSTSVTTLSVRTNLDTGHGLGIAPTGPWAAASLPTGATQLIINAGASGTVVELTFI
jgi:hypothetical protein